MLDFTLKLTQNATFPQMSAPALIEDAERLRRQVHADIDRMVPERLAELHLVLKHLDLHDLAARVDEGFDADRSAGKLAAERIAAAIRSVRLARPYA